MITGFEIVLIAFIAYGFKTLYIKECLKKDLIIIDNSNNISNEINQNENNQNEINQNEIPPKYEDIPNTPPEYENNRLFTRI